MKCQILFSGTNKKNIITFLSVELAQSVVNVTLYIFTVNEILNAVSRTLAWRLVVIYGEENRSVRK